MEVAFVVSISHALCLMTGVPNTTARRTCRVADGKCATLPAPRATEPQSDEPLCLQAQSAARSGAMGLVEVPQNWGK